MFNKNVPENIDLSTEQRTKVMALVTKFRYAVNYRKLPILVRVNELSRTRADYNCISLEFLSYIYIFNRSQRDVCVYLNMSYRAEDEAELMGLTVRNYQTFQLVLNYIGHLSAWERLTWIVSSLILLFLTHSIITLLFQ